MVWRGWFPEMHVLVQNVKLHVRVDMWGAEG